MSSIIEQVADQWVGILIGVIGTIVVWWVSRRQRKLVFCVNPVSTRVVTSGQASDLRLMYRDEALGDVDITAIQLAVWNSGNESIERSNIRKEIEVITVPPVRILEAKLREASRDSVKFKLLDSAESRDEGRVPLSWEFLEKDDGASLQLVYVGAPDVQVSVEGEAKNCRRVKRLTPSSSVKTLAEAKKERRQGNVAAGIVALAFAASFILRSVARVEWDVLELIMIFSGGAMVFVCLMFLSRMREKFPPFGY